MRTPQEWLHEFNLKVNNISSNKAPGYEPYEISVFLSDAQEAVVLGLYSGTLGADAFESTEALTSFLDSRGRQDTITVEEAGTGVKKFTDKSHVFALPDKLLFRTLESCNIEGPCGNAEAEVIPVTQDELLRVIRNPFRKQNGHRVLRLSYSNTNEENELSETKYSELISDYDINSYTVRYIERPQPIIVADLPTGYKVRGESEAMTCLLPEQIHPIILERAVQIAKSVWNN